MYEKLELQNQYDLILSTKMPFSDIESYHCSMNREYKNFNGQQKQMTL